MQGGEGDSATGSFIITIVKLICKIYTESRNLGLKPLKQYIGLGFVRAKLETVQPGSYLSVSHKRYEIRDKDILQGRSAYLQRRYLPQTNKT